MTVDNNSRWVDLEPGVSVYTDDPVTAKGDHVSLRIETKQKASFSGIQNQNNLVKSLPPSIEDLPIEELMRIIRGNSDLSNRVDATYELARRIEADDDD